ncbi:hypothetical protein [Rhodobacter sp. JA431]|uniref:hypothetical protein n=1 Tax=Rhodobacter sp. JA431 TaxID=570013 RepID=UPI000BE2B46C|nr:hypothetical protein [Rhodobacter sp. JA431]
MRHFQEIDSLATGLFLKIEEKFLERAEAHGNIIAILSRSDEVRYRFATWLRELPAFVCEYSRLDQLETLLATRGDETIGVVVNLDDYSDQEVAQIVVELRDVYPWVGITSLSPIQGAHCFSKEESWPFDVALSLPVDRVSLKLAIACAADHAENAVMPYDGQSYR